jgi:DNA-binding response OmpR family regulator
VLTNLLSNAAKFSPKDSTIEVGVTRRDNVVRVSVTDHGPGIPEEFQGRIFEKFAQADGSDQRQKGGTGLGLSITRAIVEKHGGVVDYDSRLNEGTTFYFELPLLTTLAPRVAFVASAAADIDKTCILVCEDDPDIAQLIAMMLQQQGYATVIATSAEQAKIKMRERRYSAMTLDLMLPGQDGISLVRELRASELYHDLPIIVVSAKAELGKVELNGGAVNMVDWLDKPIDQGRLLQAARRAVGAGGGIPKILHVEDDVDVLQVVATILAGQATLVPAESLRQAQNLLTTQRFDLVLLDINLPDGSGLDLLPLINQLTPPPPVTIFSANDVDAHILDKVASALVKSQTSNTLLFETISRLIDKSASEYDARRHTAPESETP